VPDGERVVAVGLVQVLAGDELVARHLTHRGQDGGHDLAPGGAALILRPGSIPWRPSHNAYRARPSRERHTDCYAPSWGRHKARTKPSVGNHEYQTPGAAGYFDYFGAAAGDRTKGYYSYGLGEWHIVVLNSNCSIVSCGAGSAQEQWLRADLAANPAACTLAYFHHPRFNSGASHGNTPAVQPLWQALYDAGNEHLYERFGPQTPGGVADAARGIRQFTVGTGGRGLYNWGTIKPNSEVRNNTTFGVLALTLGSGSYDWRFVPVQGATFTDAGTGACH
jgi:hypothetical protein